MRTISSVTSLTKLESVELRFIIQDFNPGGVTPSSRLVANLNSAFPHFCYIKLEEPLMLRGCAKLDATGGRVGVLERWGGMYMLELILAGIAGVMPGLGVSDVLSLSFRQANANDFDARTKSSFFSLQNMELFHHAEKRLLRARGILQNAFVRLGTHRSSRRRCAAYRFSEPKAPLLTASAWRATLH